MINCEVDKSTYGLSFSTLGFPALTYKLAVAQLQIGGMLAVLED